MESYRIDPISLQEPRDPAQLQATQGEDAQWMDRLRREESLRVEELDSLLLIRDVTTEELLALAEELRTIDSPAIETFCPLCPAVGARIDRYEPAAPSGPTV